MQHNPVRPQEVKENELLLQHTIKTNDFAPNSSFHVPFRAYMDLDFGKTPTTSLLYGNIYVTIKLC